MTGKNRWLMLCIFLFPQLLWGLEDQSDVAYDQLNLESLSKQTRLQAIRDFIRAHPKYAQAHYDLHKVLIEDCTPEAYQDAHRALKQALYLKPVNITYMVALGDLLWIQDKHALALGQYKKVLKRSHNEPAALVGIGRFHLGEFLKYRDLNVDGNKQFARKDFQEAVRYFYRAIEAHPSYRKAYLHLAAAYLESNQIERLVMLSRKMVRNFPDDWETLLWCGLSHHLSGAGAMAEQFFLTAKKKLSEAELAVIKAVEEDRYASDAIAYASDLESSTVSDIVDPLLLTEYNEHVLEQYGRAAYVILCLGRPEKGIKGWETDRGQTFLKFGKPLRKRMVRPGINEGSRITAMEYSRQFTSHVYRQIWYYEGFEMAFRSADGTTGWMFDTFSGLIKTARPFMIDPAISLDSHLTQRDLWRRANRIPNVSASPKSVLKSLPPRFVDPYADKRYPLFNQMTAFKRADSIRLEVSYALPKARFGSLNQKQFIIDNGLFMLDNNDQMVYRNVESGILPFSPIRKYRSPIDSLKNAYFLTFKDVSVNPGTYQIRGEVRDKISGSIGEFRNQKTLTYSDSTLQVSDLLLASVIRSQAAFPESREDLKVIPNPLRTYGQASSVYVYFEIYNLTQDEFNQTKFQVSYTLSKPSIEEIDPDLFFARQRAVPTQIERIEPPDQLSTPASRVDAFSLERENPNSDIDNQESESPDYLLEQQKLLSELVYDPGTSVVRYVVPQQQISEELVKVLEEGVAHETTVTADYLGNREDEFTYLQIDVSQVPLGIHKLTITAHDKVGKTVAQNETFFRIIQGGETTIDALFQNAIEQIGQVSRAESIVALEKIISRDKNYAPAYNELAKLHLLDHSVNGRQRAMRKIQQAIAIDSDNIEYRLTRGKILWHQGFRSRALNQFKNVIKKDPQNTAVLNGLGMFWVYDFLSQKDRRTAHHSKDFKIFAEEAKQEAIQVLRKSIQLDGTNQQPYYLLGILYFEDKYWDAFHALMQALRAQYPDDKNALLFCGLAAYQIGEFNDSHEYYQRALDLMRVEERELLNSIDLLVSQGDHASRDTMQAIDELLEREMFWKRQDPLYLSEFNERKMAHFGRMAYANLRFRRFSDDVEGWQTDMGKTYIKFGRYRRRMTAYKATWDSKEILDAAMMEFWYYENFQFKFCGTTDDIWHFCGGATVETPSLVPAVGTSAFDITPGSPGPGRSPSSFVPSILTEASHHTFRKTAQRFVDPYLERKYTLPYQITAFEEQDSVRVELSYMIPKDRLTENPETGKVSFWDGVFFFDQQWNDTYNDRQSRTLTLPAQDSEQNAAAQHRNDHLLISRTVSVRQDSYHFSVELLDQTSGLIGVARDEKLFVYNLESFHLSDLLIGSDIQAKKALPESRDDLLITPNPVRTFSQSESVFIYLELYDLQRDDFGSTQYEISYTIGKPEVDTLSPTLFASQSLIATLGKTEIDLRSEQIDDVEGQGLQTDRSENSEEGSSVFVDNNMLGETKVYTSGGQVHYIPAEDLKIKRSKDGDLTRTVTANYEGNREDDFTYLQIDVNQVPEGVYQLTVLAKDKRTDQTDRKHVYFRIVE